MTTTQPDVDTARADDLNEAHVAWCLRQPVPTRLSFGEYAISHLRQRGLELRTVKRVSRVEPRVWFDGDDVPAGTWVLVVDEEDPEERVHQLDADEDCRNGNLGPLVEIILPSDDEIDLLVAAAQARRDQP